MTKRLFDCPKCNKLPDDSFTQFEYYKDWFTTYPEENSIHIHFGDPTEDEEGNIQEVTFLKNYLFDIFKKYPQKKFFIFIDSSTIDNSELVPSESMNIYGEIFNHDQAGAVVMYGATEDLNEVALSINDFVKSEINIAKDYFEADQIFRKWQSSN